MLMVLILMVSVGTYRIRNESVLMQAVDDALRTGYRMFGKYCLVKLYMVFTK